MLKYQTVPLNAVRMDSVHARAKINHAMVATFAADMERGDVFPKPVLLYDAKKDCFWTGDGFTRLAAMLQLGRKEVEAEVRPGTKTDAMLFNIKANSEPRGQPTTIDDRRHAAKLLLKHKEHNFKTDKAIAELVGCSTGLVADVRHELSEQGVPMPSIRVGANGRVYKARSSHREPTTVVCPRCNGKGRIPRE